jgi:hypothetical protein
MSDYLIYHSGKKQFRPDIRIGVFIPALTIISAPIQVKFRCVGKRSLLKPKVAGNDAGSDWARLTGRI